MRQRITARALGIAGAALLTVGLASVATSSAGAQTRNLTVKNKSLTSKTITTAKSVSGQLARSDKRLLARTDRSMANVMVKLDVDPAASYKGGVRGYAATSPSVTGRSFAKSDPGVAAYLQHVNAVSADASKRIRAAVPAARVLRSFTVVYGGLLVRLPANRAKDLLKVQGVAAVQRDAVNHPLAAPADASVGNDSTKFVGASKVWPSLGGKANAGRGVIVGVLDTGIWPEHPMLRDTGMPTPAGGPWGCEFGDGTDPDLGPAFSCNNKLIGAYAFLDTNIAFGTIEPGEYCDIPAGVCSARDSDGHGSHTSTTAAGDAVAHADLLGVDRGPISGMAPGASVIMYRVCLEDGCYGSDSVNAVQQAIEDGVDVINFSISGGAQAYSDPVELAFLDAYAAGISVSASAGNSGPGAATADHAGPWVTTVGASTSDRAFQSRLVLTADDGSRFAKIGATVTDGVSNKRVLLADRVRGYDGGPFCLTPFAPGSVNNKVVACQRGGNARVDKGYNAMQGGAAGVILYNAVRSDVETDNHWIPAIHLDGPNSRLVNFLTDHRVVRATWTEGQKARVRGDVMTGFSSRGPLGNFVKPDVTAPGVQVLAGNTPTPIPGSTVHGPPGQYYQAIAGTSMSSPHSAGISALVKAAHPSWTPGQIKSALMTSSVQDVLNADGSQATPWDRGAGSIRANRAVSPTLTFDVPASAYYDSASDPMNRVDLNVPSINVDPLPGAVKTYRTARNVSARTQTFDVTTRTPDGLTITATPSTFTLAPNRQQRIKLLIDGTGLPDGWHFASMTIRPRSSTANDAVLPVVVNKKQASVDLSQSCDPTNVLRGEKAYCTVAAQNNAPVAVDATIKVTTPSEVAVTDVSAPAHRTAYGARWDGTLGASLPPTIDSITPGGSPAGGYLPLSAFGIAPTPGVGDETITNFSVPTFLYGGEPYGSVGVDSNGYVVIGGGTSADNDCCNPQTFPDTTRPNNVIAPYWTDLSFDPASGGGFLRVAILTDGVNDFLVIDYDHIRAYQGGGTGPESSFEVWITLGGTEGTSFAYGTLGGTNGQPASYGAENRTGTSGVNIPAPSSDTDYSIQTSPPSAGGAVSFDYAASSRTAGVFKLVTSLTTPAIKGTTAVQDTLTVNQ